MSQLPLFYGLHSWYEDGLPALERKKRGHYSTPLPLVEQILDACGYTPDADLTGMRVLDPACGSGNFLVGAARRLLACTQRLGLTPQEQTRLLVRNMWGFDPDPVSCFLATMQLSSQIAGAGLLDSSSRGDEILSAAKDDMAELDRQNSSSNLYERFHIHQADSLTLPWEPCADLFLANPPYLAAKNTDLSGYRSALQRGQADSYLLFLSLAMQVVRPGGWMGLVLPDPVLARINAARERAQLLREMTVHYLWHFANVFPADVGAVVLVAQHRPPTTMHQVVWVRARWQPSQPSEQSQLPHSSLSPAHSASQPHAPEGRRVAQALLLRQPAAELRYLLSNENGSLLDRLRACLEDSSSGPGGRRLAPLGDFVTISRGEELGRESPLITRYGDTPSEGTEGGANIPTLAKDGREGTEGDASVPTPQVKDRRVETEGGASAPTPLIYHPRPYGWLPVLRGGIDVRAYAAPRVEWRIDCEAVTKPMERYLAPKLLVVKSTDRLQAVLDTRGHVVLQTLYLLHVRNHAEQGNQRGRDEQIDLLYFFLALLNSRLLREYVYVLHTAYKWVQPQIEQRVLAALPVPLVNEEVRAEIIEQAKRLESACSRAGAVVEWDEEVGALYDSLERTIRGLYLSACNNDF